MAITNKTQAIAKLNSDVTASDDNLRPTNNNPIKHGNLAAYLENFLNWMFKDTTSDLRGKVLTVERTAAPITDYSNLNFISMIPLGGIMMYPVNGHNTDVGNGVIKAMIGGIEEVEGFLFLDGSTILNVGQGGNNSRYKDLRTVLNGYYGNTTNMNELKLPDMRGRVPLGYDNRTTNENAGVNEKNYQNCGNTGGATSVTLGINDIPSHNHGGGRHAHSVDSYTKTHGNNNVPGNGGGFAPGYGGEFLRTEYTREVGDGLIQPQGNNNNKHENRQEYMVVNYLIRYI